MPPSDDTTGESFRGLVLQLRGRTGLTQRELAARIGVHVSSIQGWEAGANYPGVASLQALIAAGLQAGGFTAGREREEAQALWAAALRDAPRFRMPFDGAWFEQIAAGRREPVQDDAERAVAAPPAPLATAGSARRASWGEAPDVAGFLGRASEREMLRQWVLDERCRVVAVLGLGGIGKSLLATRLAHDLAPSFERVFWRSLRDAPTPGEWLAEALGFLAPERSQPESRRRVRSAPTAAGAAERGALPAGAGQLRDGAPARRSASASIGRATSGTARCSGRSPKHRTGAASSSPAARSRRSSGRCGASGARSGSLDLGGLRRRGRAGPAERQAARRRRGRVAGAGRAVRRQRPGAQSRRRDDPRAVRRLDRRLPGVRDRDAGRDGRRRAPAPRGADRSASRTWSRSCCAGMAVEREPVGLAELAADLGPRIGRAATLEAVEGLRRRSLLERTERGPLFGLHSVVLEYVTEQLIEDVAQELASGELDRLLRQPLLKATAKEYVRRSQERLIAAPLVERLVETRGSARAAEQRLVGLLDEQRGRPVEDQGYGPGNLVNLLRLLRGDLKGVDLSGLAIRQAYLQDVEAQGASLAGAHLSETVLGEAFSYPTSLALSADGAYLAAGTASGEVCWWRVADRTLLATLPGHAGAVWGVALSGDGRLVASGGVDGTVRLWEAESGRPLATLHGHAGGVCGVALSGDGRLVASGGSTGRSGSGRRRAGGRSPRSTGTPAGSAAWR